MRALLSTIGTRGDVQPLIALASELRTLGEEVRLCVPPDFRETVERLGFDVATVGPELRPMAAHPSPAGPAPTPEQRRQFAEATVAAQFDAVDAAARGCDVIVAATSLQIAARSVAEASGIPYVFVAYCPAVLPSLHHAPPSIPLPATVAIRELWERDAATFDDMFGLPLDARRAELGLAPAGPVRSHVLTDTPWLAADGVLAPWPGDGGGAFQTGAWILPDDRPLPDDLEAFLDAGDPPVYVGFGSIAASPDLGRDAVAAARAVGRRTVVSRGWAELTADDGPDCISVGEVNQQLLFRRVAAVIHHGGAGTTTTAAVAGARQVVVPQSYDQHYWASRVEDLRIGVAHAPGTPSRESLATALERVLTPDAEARARAVGRTVRLDGAQVAAEALVGAVGQR